MIDLLLGLSGVSTPAGALVAEAVERFTTTGKIGLILILIIEIPVIILIMASILGSPRTFRVPALFIGSLVLMVAMIVISLAIICAILKLIVPG